MKLSSLVQLVLGLALASIAPVSSWAQIVFTVTAQANSTAAGYESGSTYTFVFTCGLSFSNSATSEFVSGSGGYNSWHEDTPTDDQIWTAIGGSGLSGAYARPGDPTNILVHYESSGNLNYNLIAQGPGNARFGLTTPDNSAIGRIQANFGYADSNAVSYFKGNYAEPLNATSGYFTTFFTNSHGADGYIQLNGTDGESSYSSFTVTSFILGAAAVPEPSTYAALADLAARPEVHVHATPQAPETSGAFFLPIARSIRGAPGRCALPHPETEPRGSVFPSFPLSKI